MFCRLVAPEEKEVSGNVAGDGGSDAAEESERSVSFQNVADDGRRCHVSTFRSTEFRRRLESEESIMVYWGLSAGAQRKTKV